MKAILLLSFLIFSDDLNRADFSCIRPVYKSISVWDLMVDEMLFLQADPIFVYRDYDYVYDLCKKQNRKLTVIKNVKNPQKYIDEAIEKGDYVYITEDDPKFPVGVGRYFIEQSYQYELPVFNGSC